MVWVRCVHCKHTWDKRKTKGQDETIYRCPKCNKLTYKTKKKVSDWISRGSGHG